MSYLQREENNLQIERGRRLWQRILREYQKKYRISFTDEDIGQRIAGFHYPDMESFLREIGSGKKALDRQTLKTLFPELTAVEVKTVRKTPRNTSPENQLITVEGQEDIDFTIARCCSPIKGEEIIGYMTKNRGLVDSPERLSKRQLGDAVENQAGFLEPDRPLLLQGAL